MSLTSRLRSIAARSWLLAVAMTTAASIVLTVLALNFISSGREISQYKGEVETLKGEVEALIDQLAQEKLLMNRLVHDACVTESIDRRGDRMRDELLSRAPGGLLLVDIASGGLEMHRIRGADPSWSPDGRRIAFVDEGPTGCTDIFIWTLGDDRIESVTSDPWSDRDPAWNPTKDSITFVSNRTGSDEIFSISLDNSEITQITITVPAGYADHNEASWARSDSPSWSQDGKNLAYCRVPPFDWEDPGRNPAGTHIVNLENDESWSVRRSEDFFICAASWSPDGYLLAAGALTDGLVITDATGYVRGRISPVASPQEFECEYDGVRWSPRGDSLAFIVGSCGDKDGLYVADIAVVSIRTAAGLRPWGRVRIANSRKIELGSLTPSSSPSFSPDGRMLVLAVSDRQSLETE